MMQDGVTFELHGMQRLSVGLDAFTGRQFEKIKNAFEYVCRLIANDARQDPGGFKDQTTNLRNSINVAPNESAVKITKASKSKLSLPSSPEVTIGYERGTFKGVIFAGMEYSIYVEMRPGHYVIGGAFKKYHDKWLGLLAEAVRGQI